MKKKKSGAKAKPTKRKESQKKKPSKSDKKNGTGLRLFMSFPKATSQNDQIFYE